MKDVSNMTYEKGCIYMINRRLLIRITIMTLILLMIGYVCSFSEDEEVAEMKVGDVIGSFKKSDVEMTVEVNCYEKNLSTDVMLIPVYEVENELCFIAEDLVYYGYSSIWNPEERTTRLFVGSEKKNTSGTSRFIKNEGYIYFTDIKLFIDGEEMEVYNINGYSLVKMSDVSKMAGSIDFERVLDPDEKIELSGQIILPNGDVAHEGGIEVSPIFYYFDSGYLRKYIGDLYVIEEGKSIVDYSMELPVHDYWNRMGFNDHRIYKYIGYEIYDENGYVSYDLENTTDMAPMYLERLWYYQESYDDLDINILNEQSVKMTLSLDGDVFEFSSKGWKRGISVIAADKMNNKRIVQTKSVNGDEKEIEFVIDLISDREYSFIYQIKVFGGFTSGLPLPPTPQYPTYYYHDGVASTNYEELTYIKANNENSDITVDIKLQDIIIGDVYKSDKKIIYDSKELSGYIVNGRYLVDFSDIRWFGHSSCTIPEVETFESIDGYTVKDGSKPVGRLTVSNYKAHENEVYIPIYFLAIDGVRIECVLIDDLKAFGYEVNYGETIELNL